MHLVAHELKAKIVPEKLSRDIAGLVYIEEDLPIIGVNTVHDKPRQRFTVAHELGHVAFHKDIIREQVHVDRSFSYKIFLTRERASQIEVEANLFATECLMPMSLLRKVIDDYHFDIEDDRPVELLSEKFQVSRGAMHHHLRNVWSSLRAPGSA